MLIPRFGIRTMLVITTICAVVAGTVSWAMSGVAWAAGMASAVALLAVAFVLYGLLFVVAFGLSWLRRLAPGSAGGPNHTASTGEVADNVLGEQSPGGAGG